MHPPLCFPQLLASSPNAASVLATWPAVHPRDVPSTSPLPVWVRTPASDTRHPTHDASPAIAQLHQTLPDKGVYVVDLWPLPMLGCVLHLDSNGTVVAWEGPLSVLAGADPESLIADRHLSDVVGGIGLHTSHTAAEVLQKGDAVVGSLDARGDRDGGGGGGDGDGGSTHAAEASVLGAWLADPALGPGATLAGQNQVRVGVLACPARDHGAACLLVPMALEDHPDKQPSAGSVPVTAAAEAEDDAGADRKPSSGSATEAAGAERAEGVERDGSDARGGRGCAGGGCCGCEHGRWCRRQRAERQ